MTPDDWLRENAGTPEKIDLGLERCKQVLALCDLDTLPFQVFTVAGTNGKGSTIAILDAILSASGLLTGRYSSPHLIRFNERILLTQQEQNDVFILEAFKHIKQKAGDISLSYFEYATIASLLIFAQQGVDVALMEVGLGGRLDACNAVDPDVTAISSIALDHQDWLGNDLESIGHEKAGIMRSNMPCILASGNLPESIYAYANDINASVVQLGEDYSFSQQNNTWQWTDKQTQLELALPSLSGNVQLQNAAAAIAMLRHSQFWPLPIKQINSGLQNIKLAGRLQELSLLDREWILDVAHNPASMQVLCDYLDRYDVNSASCVFSMLTDKDTETCIRMLAPKVHKWFITELDSPRAMSVIEIKEQLLGLNIAEENIVVLASVKDACHAGVNNTAPQDTLLVCGSFYTVGEALEFMQSNQL